eukprot:6862335-Pyramimonas_sp.AAC.1
MVRVVPVLDDRDLYVTGRVDLESTPEPLIDSKTAQKRKRTLDDNQHCVFASQKLVRQIKSFRHVKKDLWVEAPGSLVVCDGYCGRRVPQAYGDLMSDSRADFARSAFSRGSFVCKDCRPAFCKELK